MPEAKLRQSQDKILAYSSGKMGVAAVPGSGKTWTLSHLAAKLIMTTDLEDDQEILILTLTNSAADNFSSRIGKILHDSKLIEGFGYRVRTLHGLANDIIHIRPELAGLPNDYAIFDDQETNAILDDEVHRYLKMHSEFFDDLVDLDAPDKKIQKLKDDDFPNLMRVVSSNWIKQAKDLGQSPADLQLLINQQVEGTELVNACNEIYAGYQTALNNRVGLDFSDLISLAYRCLQNDPDLLSLLRHRWPFVLEDEAQDSSALQQKILELLCGPEGNWVRVGDPNQAIYESFTTANPELLKNFVRQSDVLAVDLPESGRSCPVVISLANNLIDWSGKRHPNMNVRDALSLPHILPTPEGDLQQNPTDRPDSLSLNTRLFTPQEEIGFLIKDINAYRVAHPKDTIAVLAALNKRVAVVSDSLEKAGLPVCKELLRTAEPVRLSAGAIAHILLAINDPEIPAKLRAAFRVVHREDRDNAERWTSVEVAGKWLAALKQTEDFLYPNSNQDWKQAASVSGLDEAQIYLLEAFRLLVYDWHQAAILPLDQIIQIVSMDLNLTQAETAAVYHMAMYVKDLQQKNPESPKETLINELVEIAMNKRGFISFSEEKGGFEPDAHPGEVVVATFHKGKGLEWDKVYLSSCSNYDFPSGDPADSYIAESYVLKDRLNLEAEALAQMQNLLEGKPLGDFHSGYAAISARDTYIRERLRVLYVGITRARKSLTITVNNGGGRNVPAVALKQLIQMQGGQL
jgi:DNA helicase-2/ATP-dependent DNA helicase PcrA